VYAGCRRKLLIKSKMILTYFIIGFVFSVLMKITRDEILKSQPDYPTYSNTNIIVMIILWPIFLYVFVAALYKASK
jgi:F0F1-type ATP synthase membrane subunit c/vacuolar-type H+-ATPase subunit K